MKAFKYFILHEEENVLIETSGAINERARIPHISEIPPNLPIIVNLEKVNYINSTGTGMWISWLNQILESKDHGPIELEHCPPEFIKVLNLSLDSWPKNFGIKSFYLPLYCTTCEKKLHHLLQKEVGYRDTDN